MKKKKFVEKKKKGEKIFGDENIFLCRRIKTDMEKEENIWRRKIYFCGGGVKRKGKGGKHLERESFYLEKRRNIARIANAVQVTI